MCRPFLFLIVGGIVAGSALAQAPGELRILDSQEVDLGDRKIIYNRLETPVLKPQAETQAPPAIPVKEAEPAPDDTRPYLTVFFSVTTHPHGISQVRWNDGTRENVVWSNVDFRDFSSLSTLESPAAIYSILLIADEWSAGVPPATLPPASAGPAWWAASPLTPEATQMMKDFHEHYRLHGSTLAAQRREQEAAAEAHAAWLKANPPEPKDTVINYFPIRSDYGNAREEPK